MSRHSFGTSIRTGIDQASLRKATQGVGSDLRHWVSHGTVCTLDTETGELDYKDKRAILNGPEGVEVDVELEPLGHHVTCLYSGIQAGEATILAPIRPGDRVLVVSPDGDLTTPIIVNILHSRSNRQPLGDDKKPIFDNARLIIHTKTVPIDVRTGNARVLIDQDGTVTTKATHIVDDCGDIKLGGTDADEPYLLGNQWKDFENTILSAIASHTHLVPLPSPTSPTPSLPPTEAASFTGEIPSLGTKLSGVIKGK